MATATPIQTEPISLYRVYEYKDSGMRYVIADKDICRMNGVDMAAHRVVDGMMILNENDLLGLGETAEAGAGRLGCQLMSDSEAQAWLYEHR